LREEFDAARGMTNSAMTNGQQMTKLQDQNGLARSWLFGFGRWFDIGHSSSDNQIR
jgi:hypothetical protein